MRWNALDGYGAVALMYHGRFEEVIMEDSAGREFAEGFVAVAGEGSVQAIWDGRGEVGIEAFHFIPIGASGEGSGREVWLDRR